MEETADPAGEAGDVFVVAPACVDDFLHHARDLGLKAVVRVVGVGNVGVDVED